MPTQGGRQGAQDGRSGVPRQRGAYVRADQRPVPGEEPSDATLLARMRRGDDHAYEELYRRHAEAVRRYARTCCRDAHTAEDLTNEVFARALQAVRYGSGPRSAVRAYLLTSVRRVAAAWATTARREHLVEDFAVFAQSAAGASATSDADTLDLGADVRAMHEADQSLAVRAFRSLPERYQTVLWHTTVEDGSPKEVAPLLGLTDNATAVLAHRAREKLRQAYLQEHVSRALVTGGDCAGYADRLGAYARGGLRMRAERGLRKHLEECGGCRTAALEVLDLNEQIRVLVPVAFIGWFAAGGGAKALAALLGGGAAAGAGTGVTVASGVTAGGGGAAGSGAAGGGTTGGTAGGAASTTAGLTVGAFTAIGVVVALLLAGNSGTPPQKAQTRHSAAPVLPSRSGAESGSGPGRAAPGQSPGAERRPDSPRALAPPAAAGRPGPAGTASPASVVPELPANADPRPGPLVTYPLHWLGRQVRLLGRKPDRPTVRLGSSVLLWPRSGLRIHGTRYGQGVSVHAPSTVTIDLNRACTTYNALAGVDEATLGNRGARFAVYGDGTRLWRSGVVRRDEAPVRVRVPLDGVRTLRLVVRPHGPLNLSVLADWARAEIRCR